MKSTKFTAKFISLVLSVILIAVMGIFVSSCGKTETPNESSSVAGVSSDTSSTSNYLDDYGDIAQNVGSVNTAKNQFIFKATDLEGYTYIYRVFTDKTNIGEALSEVDLISGENTQYGLFGTAVRGIKAEGKTAWMLYINDEQAMTGVDGVTLEPKTEYTFRLEAY